MDEIVGIIGGIGPSATIYFSELLTRDRTAQRDQDRIRFLHFSNPKVPDRTDFLLGKGEDPLPELIFTVETLERGGVTSLCMPCNTAHAPQILERLLPYMHVPFVDMVEATVKATLAASKSAKVAVLGTEGTRYAGTYSVAFKRHGILEVVPSKLAQEEITKVIYDIKRRGVRSEDTGTLLHAIAITTADVYVLACTELSLLYEPLRTSAPDILFVDSLRSLAGEFIDIETI